jgi:RecJ-like exonuclease
MNLIKKRCCKCQGVGLLQLKTPQVCQGCSNVNGKMCYKCEYRGGVQTIKECELCDGYGELFYEEKTMKQQYLYALKNYKIIS